MLQGSLVVERIVISSYQEIIGWNGDGDCDPKTRQLVGSIRKEEDAHGRRPGRGAQCVT